MSDAPINNKEILNSCSNRFSNRIVSCSDTFNHGIGVTTSGASSEFEDSSFALSSGPSSATLSASRVRLRAFHALSHCGLSHLTNQFVAGLLFPFLLFHRTFQLLIPKLLCGPSCAEYFCRFLPSPEHRCSNPSPSRIA